MSKTDQQLKYDVEQELAWDPRTRGTQLDVQVENGVVSFKGEINHYPQIRAAAEVCLRVGGVRAVTDDLTVRLLAADKRSDEEIAAAARSAHQWDVWVPSSVSATVTEGRIALEGEVAWQHERAAAERAVSGLNGVVGVSNELKVRSESAAALLEKRVQANLAQLASGTGIHAQVVRSKVRLSGQASSCKAIEQTIAAIWRTPGVTAVVDAVRLTESTAPLP